MDRKRNGKLQKRLRTTAALLAAISIVMAGCSENGGTGEADTRTPSEPGAGDAGGSNDAGKDGAAGTPAATTYPIDTDETFSYWGAINGNLITFTTDLGESPFGKALEKATGVDVKYIHPSEGQEVEQFNLMIASDELPNVMEYNWATYPGGPEKAISDQVIVPLNDLIDRHAPNLKRLLASDPELDRMIKTDSGQYYAFPMVRSESSVVFRGPILRKDWLDELGLEVPTTVDEWYTVLKAFKEKKGATAPFTARYDNKMNIQDAFFGAYRTANDFYLDDNGKVRFGPLDPQYKDVIALFRKWYEEGLIDKDFPIVDSKALDKKMLNGESGATVYLLGGGMGKWLESAQDPNFDLVGAPYPVLNEGETPFTGQRDFKYNPKPSAAITTSMEHPELAVKWLDYAFGEEGMMLFNFGIEGESYKIENGVPTFTDTIMKNEKYTSQQMLSQYTLPNGPYPVHEQKTTNTFPQQNDAVRLWSKTDAAKHILPAFITPTVEESNKVAQIMTQISTYKEEMFIKFVMGNEPIDNFDAYAKQIESMGIQEVIDIYQAAMDRYNKR
jgi:putative aldouronate transport system substrate-binding protein